MLTKEQCRFLHLHPEESVIRSIRGKALEKCCVCLMTGGDRLQWLSWKVETETARGRWNNRHLCDVHAHEVAKAYRFHLRVSPSHSEDRFSVVLEALKIAGGAATIRDLQIKTEDLPEFGNFDFRGAIESAVKRGLLVSVGKKKNQNIWAVKTEAIADAS
jgi:hypothetical protein